jgi:sulfite reductase (ferredoxin)
LEADLVRLGLENEKFTVRMTGCPNGCARPYNADIGMVGKTKNKYTIFLGGSLRGDRLAFLYREIVPLDELAVDTRARVRLLQAGTPGRRDARRFLPAQGRPGLAAVRR